MTSFLNAIYLDNNAASMPGIELFSAPFANPSSVHRAGQYWRARIEEARDQVAVSIGPNIHPEELVFTSSGTEANQQAIRSALGQSGPSPAHWITTRLEHDSINQMLSWAKDRGIEISTLRHDENGRVLLNNLGEIIKPNTRLISVIWANNETGVINPIEDLISWVRVHRPDVLVHIDAAQAWGKLNISDASRANYLTFSGQKIGAMPGTGVLRVKPGSPLTPMILGHQERGRRGGTENILGLVSLGLAAQKICPISYRETVADLRDFLELKILERMPEVKIVGRNAPRVANTSLFLFPQVSGESLVIALDLAGFCVSSGAACSSGATEPSPVLLALNVEPTLARSALRVSLGLNTTKLELLAFIEKLTEIVSSLVKENYGLRTSRVESSRSHERGSG